MLDPLQPDALERVRSAAINPHLHCMCFPAMPFSVADRRLVPLLEIASDHGLAVLFTAERSALVYGKSSACPVSSICVFKSA